MEPRTRDVKDALLADELTLNMQLRQQNEDLRGKIKRQSNHIRRLEESIKTSVSGFCAVEREEAKNALVSASIQIRDLVSRNAAIGLELNKAKALVAAYEARAEKSPKRRMSHSHNGPAKTGRPA